MSLSNILIVICILAVAFDSSAALTFAFRKSWKFPQMRRSKNLLYSAHLQQDNLQKDHVDQEMLRVSFFSFLHNAAMPFADLVDGSFLSTLDASSLGAVGVVRASQNSVSKLYMSPLSKTTISLIASASGEQDDESSEDEKDHLPTAVSSALAMAILFGSIQATVFILGAKQILGAAGIQTTSAMYIPAMAFMRARALSAPTSTLWLVATNVFRGLGDATTPMLCAILLNVVNLFGDYILIEKLNVGIAGTAIGTTVAQFVALVPLLFVLNKKVNYWLKLNVASFLRYLSQYGRAGVFLVGRSIARIASVSYISRRSALFGSVSASSYTVLYQIGMWVTILSDGVSIATQSLLSRYLAQNNDEGTELCKHVIKRSFQIGLALSSALTILLYTFRRSIISLLTKQADIQAAALQAYPVFLLAQVAKGFAFPVNGVIMGGMDWGVAMWSMWCANVSCFVALRFVEHNARGLWMAWTAYYCAQAVSGFLRYKSRTGVWKRFKEPLNEK